MTQPERGHRFSTWEIAKKVLADHLVPAGGKIELVSEALDLLKKNNWQIQLNAVSILLNEGERTEGSRRRVELFDSKDLRADIGFQAPTDLQIKNNHQTENEAGVDGLRVDYWRRQRVYTLCEVTGLGVSQDKRGLVIIGRRDVAGKLSVVEQVSFDPGGEGHLYFYTSSVEARPLGA